MCQFSQPDLDDTVQAQTDATTQRAKSTTISTTPPEPSPSFPLTTSNICSPCTRGWWSTTLSTTSRNFTTHLPLLTAHLRTLSTNQKRMHRLARRCTQARLYPNPASPNSKAALQTQLDELTSRMHSAAKVHTIYAAELAVYTFPVQAIIDSLRLSGRECHCTACKSEDSLSQGCARAEIQDEAGQLMDTIAGVKKSFEELEVAFLEKWEDGGRQGLQGTIDKLLDAQALREKSVVRKFFPRQVREMEGGVRPNVLAMRSVVETAEGAEKGRCDSGCEASL